MTNSPATAEHPDDDTEHVDHDTFNIDYYAEHVDPDDDGYLFGTAMGRSDS